MNLKEIERKFLVKDLSFINDSCHQKTFIQGYLNSDKNRTVRVRIANDKGFLTIKGNSNESGTTRFEWEKEIDILEAKSLIELCEPGVIVKTRYFIKQANHTFEVDVFEGDNKGLIVAEIELQDEIEYFEKPTWLGDEVTGDVKYYNSQLTKKPFTKW